jgi:hypothetical protein
MGKDGARKQHVGGVGFNGEMCRLESSVWAGNVLVEINRTTREAEGAMTCPPHRAEIQLSFTFQSK